MKLSNNSMSSSVMFAYTKPHYVLLDGLRGVVAMHTTTDGKMELQVILII